MAKPSHQEVVLFFNSDDTVASEMMMTDFVRHLEGELLDARAASVVQAAYAVVANGLNLVGIVYFIFRVDENGKIDKSFNLPFKYLVQQAGFGADLGRGSIRKASRGSCPIPWHATNLWEPRCKEVLNAVQQRLYRNKLNLKVAPNHGEDFFAESPNESLAEQQPRSDYQFLGTDRAITSPASEHPDSRILAARLEQVLGQDGRLTMQDLMLMHSDQLNSARSAHRQTLEEQQATYLAQIKTFRDEIHELKVALRQEQGRNRRLQEILRREL